jgi:hypothetical protein
MGFFPNSTPMENLFVDSVPEFLLIDITPVLRANSAPTFLMESFGKKSNVTEVRMAII